jgi:hypothetical protein
MAPVGDDIPFPVKVTVSDIYRLVATGGIHGQAGDNLQQEKSEKKQKPKSRQNAGGRSPACGFHTVPPLQ